MTLDTYNPVLEANSTQCWIDRLDRGLAGLLHRMVLRRIGNLNEGQINLIGCGRQEVLGHEPELQATIHIANPAFYRALALRGSVGAGEGYMEGHWSTDNLVTSIRVFARNAQVLEKVEGGLSRFCTPLLRLGHALRRNSRRGSRRNIREHYDLGNDFFALFLDKTMMYSSAIFPSRESDLFQASQHKLETVCQKLDLGPADHLLEIGTGWGGLALYAARKRGCRVTTVTVSENQFKFLQGQVREQGLEDQIRVLLRDYRDLEGQYDKLVSIEMIEAVGHQYWDLYFSHCNSLLRPGGLMLLQAITIADQYFEAAKKSVDFVKKYIFPGSCLPSLAAISDCVARETQLKTLDVEDITEHYVRTLREWRKRFWKQIEGVRSFGYSERFIRMWDYYLAYCEAGFTERHIGDVQILFEKEGEQ